MKSLKDLGAGDRGEANRLSAALAVTSKSAVEEASSRNAVLLMKAGYIARLGSGLYTLLPLGLRVLNRIESIVRHEMNALGANEFLSPIIYPKDLWSATGRWDSIDTLFKLRSRSNAELCIAATAEEVVTSVVKNLIRSYRDLPLALYQIQQKCRDELRARSGLLRGREFRMKDLYSFHLNAEELDEFYERVCDAYMRIFSACGVGHKTVRTFASGGVFSRFSDEFQLLCESGEDTIYRADGHSVAINQEVAQDVEARKAAFGDAAVTLTEYRAIEIGNTFKLGTKFSTAFDLVVADPSGERRPVLMCSYGIGTTRLVGAVAELCNDDKGLLWPASISPYDCHVVVIGDRAARAEVVDKVMANLVGAGCSVLLDDRDGVRAGEKLADADLLGIPTHVIVGAKSGADMVECKVRATGQYMLTNVTRLAEMVKL